MFYSNAQPLIDFLDREFALPMPEIQIGLRQSEREQGPIPTVLLKYGFITLDQFDRVQQWLVQSSN
jgi:hypothetical protein